MTTYSPHELFQLYLPAISHDQTLHGADNIDFYTQVVTNFLIEKKLFITENEIREQHENPDVQNSFRYREVESSETNTTSEPVWVDLLQPYIFTPKDGKYYSIFFAYRLPTVDLIYIDKLLNYHFQVYFTRDISVFSRFLMLTLRQYENLVGEAHRKTIQEWIEQKEKQQQTELSGINKNIKGRPKREADDNLTTLNQELTTLLIHYLQKGNTIFKGEYLSNKLAGEAFHVLTGYSAETIRQSLSEAEMKRIASKKNLDQLHNHLTYITNLINKDIKQNK